MAGIDYNLAPIDLREQFSFTDEGLFEAYKRLRKMTDAFGAVLISTCNRTELYISYDGDIAAFDILCCLAGVNGRGLPHYGAHGSDVMRHLCRLGIGAKSQILGEDQIIAQVKDAISKARKHCAADNILEALFRESIAAAKRIKSEIRLGAREDSVVHRAMDVIISHGGVKSALVIGNGETGRLMTQSLVENGVDTTMTLRTYRHGEALTPPGARTIDYAARYERLCGCDAVISATRSLHHTITIDQVQKLAARPKLWLDLAVPRDIEPGVAELPGARYYDVDSLSAGDPYHAFEEKEARAEEIIEEYVVGFEKWLDYQKVINGEGRQEYFPLFVSSKGKKAIIAGGGKVAARRAQTLMRFEFDITVVAIDALPEIERLHDKGRLTFIRRKFVDADLDGCFIVAAATDDRETNSHIGRLAAQRGIFASVADSLEECGFLFPAIAVSGDVVAGLTSGGKSHRAVVEAAKKVREIL